MSSTKFAPKNSQSSVCWCLSWRLSSKENRQLLGTARADKVRELCARPLAPGVLAYLDGEVAGWAGIAPRSKRGVTGALNDGAVDYARASGAPAVEGHPVDNAGARVDQTMTFVGTRGMFERAGFAKVADTSSVSGGFPRAHAADAGLMRTFRLSAAVASVQP